MRAKPDMKPWVYVDKTEKSSDEERHYSALAWFVSLWGRSRGSAAPKGAQRMPKMINPGLAPWAMQECRPKGLFLHPTPINSFYLMCLPRRQRVPHNAMVSLCVFVAIHFVFLWLFTLSFCGHLLCVFAVKQIIG